MGLSEEQYIRVTGLIEMAQRYRYPITHQHVDTIAEILAERTPAPEQPAVTDEEWSKAQKSDLSPALDRCPFCGSDDITLACPDEGYQEKCESCEARGPLVKTRQESYRSWVARKQSAAASDVVEEIARAMHMAGIEPCSWDAFSEFKRNDYRKMATAAYEVARKHCEQEYGKDLIAEPKPALQETVLREAHRVSDDFDTTAGEIVKLVRADGRVGE